MTCGRIEELMDKFLEVVRRALGELSNTSEYCVYYRDVRGYYYPRPNPELPVYACGAYASLFRSYRLLVVPGAVIAYNVYIDDTWCRAFRDFDAVVRFIQRRPHYEVCIFEKPVDMQRAMVCA
jgi:hypothetical protein